MRLHRIYALLSLAGFLFVFSVGRPVMAQKTGIEGTANPAAQQPTPNAGTAGNTTQNPAVQNQAAQNAMGNLPNSYWQSHWNWFDNVYQPYHSRLFRNNNNGFNSDNSAISNSWWFNGSGAPANTFQNAPNNQTGNQTGNPFASRNNAFQNAPNSGQMNQFAPSNNSFRSAPDGRFSNQFAPPNNAFQNAPHGGQTNQFAPPNNAFQNGGPGMFNGSSRLSPSINGGSNINATGTASGNAAIPYGWW